MARIPIYRQTQLPSANFRVSELRVPDMNLDAVGNALQDVGRSVGKAAETSIRIEEEEAKTWASQASSDAELKWKMRLKEIQEDSTIATGDTITTILNEFDGYADTTLEETPPNSISRKLLQNNLRSLRKDLWTNALSYQATQGRAERIGRMENSILTSGQVIALDPNEAKLGEIMGQREAEIDSLKVMPSERERLKQNLRMTLGRSGAESMARNQPGVLLAQIDAAKKRGAKDTSGNAYLDLLDSTEWDTYINMAQQEADVVNVEGAAEAVWNELGPKSDLAPVNMDQMGKYVREN